MALKNQTGFPARPLSGVADRFWTRSIEIGADSRDGRAESSYRLSIDPNGHFLRPGNEGERIVLRRQARAREALDRAAVGLRPEDAQALHAQAHKHKASKKRRDWRKLHIGVDAKGFIVAAELTASSRDDASTLPDLLAPLEVPIRRFTADGAYDHRSVYDRASAAGTENVVIVIPSHRSTLSAGPTDGPWAQREASLQRMIRKVGRREWQKESGYRQQARVENSFFRYKSVFGGGLKARHSKAQRREAAIGCHILNRMAELGRPSSYALGR